MPNWAQSRDIGQNSDDDISRTSGDDIDRKIGPVTKPDKRNKKSLRKFDDEVM